MLLVLCALSPARLHAEDLPALTLAGDAACLPLQGYLTILDGDGSGLGVADVARSGEFQPLSPATSGLRPGIRWYRFTVLRPVGAPAQWTLAFGEPDLDDVRVYVPAPGGGFTEARLGRRIPSRDLPLAARRHVAALELPAAEPVTVYLRLASERKIRFEDVALWRPDALLFEEARSATLYGILAGILLVVVTVYALFGMWLRDGAMLIYSLYVGAILARSGTHSGIVALVFPASGGDINYLLMGGGLLGGSAAFIFMWDKILDLRRNFPAMHRIYRLAGSMVVLCLPAVLTPLFPLMVRPAQALMLALSLSSIVLAALLARRNPKDVLIRFYLCAFLPVVLVWAAEIGAVLSLVPFDLGRRMDLIATMTHIAILSVALAYRLRRNQHEQMQTEVALAGERLARQRLRTFLDMATHEFKTPLAVIDSAAQVLEMLTAPGRPGITDRIATIRRSVLRLVKLIETCLAGERETNIALGPVVPADLLRWVAERNRDPDRAELVVHTAHLPESCLADGDLLIIALDALIDNARRYGGADQPIEIEGQGEDGAMVFVVRDRGPGVRDDEAAHVFDKYYRGAASTSVPGTGIGLHLVKTIAELHGGHVSYRPRDGGGACFALVIPARPVPSGPLRAVEADCAP